MKMSAQKDISPSRRYRVTMMAEDETQVQQNVTLPIGLANNSASVEIWYQKYVPEGHLMIEIFPVEEEDPEESEFETDFGLLKRNYGEDTETEGFGDSLNFIGEEPAVKGRERPTEEDDEPEEKDDGGPFVDETPAPPKAEV